MEILSLSQGFKKFWQFLYSKTDINKIHNKFINKTKQRERKSKICHQTKMRTYQT